MLAYFSIGFYFWSTQDRAVLKPRGPVATTPANLDPPLDFEPVVIDVRQSSVHAFWIPASEPQAPVALYLHGQDGSIGKILGSVQELHELGCHVLVIDYRGFGQTFESFTPTEASVYEDTEAAWKYLTTTRRFLPNEILIYGHSLGGAVAIELASRHPDAGALVAESTFTSVAEMARWRYAIMYLLPVDWLLRHRFESLEKVRSGELPPVLFIHGKADTKVPVGMCQSLHAAALGPDKQILLIEHGLHADRGPGEAVYRETMTAFLNKCFPR